MGNCDIALEQISASLDGALNDKEQSALNKHLAECAACSALYTELCALHTAATQLEELSAPVGFADTVMAAIAAQPAQDKPDNVIPFTTKRKTRTLWTKWAAAAAAVAIVALGAVSIPSLGGNMEVAMDSAARTEPMAPQAYQTENSVAEDSEIYYSQDSAPAEAESAESAPEMPAAAAGSTSDLFVAQQEQALNTPVSDAADYCGTLTLPPDALPEGLEQYESLVGPDGTVTYVVPADYFFSVVRALEAQESASFRYGAAQDNAGAEYGLILVKPLS